MIHWILKTALLLAGFYAFFMLFMRKTTLFRLNRAVLLAGTVACLLLPLVRINVDPSAPVADYLPLRIVLPETVVGGGNVSEAAAGGWDWKALLYGVYAAGVTTVLIFAAVSLGRIRKVIRLLAAMSFNATDGGNDVMSGTDDLVGAAEPVAAGPESADTAKVYEFSALDVPPKFNGGDARQEFPKWFYTRLVYPKDARDAGKEGRVYVQFTINRDGSVSDISLMEGICESIDNEVIRVVSESPVWTPGYIDGKPVNVTYAFPVIFRL